LKRSTVSSISKRERLDRQTQIPPKSKWRFNKCQWKKRSRRRLKSRLLKSGIRPLQLKAANLLFLHTMTNQKVLKSMRLVALNQRLIEISLI
jgi:hypothetical protein